MRLMTTLHHPSLQPPGAQTSRLRVLFVVDVLDDHQERFLEAYERIRHQVSAVPGHLSDQLCQSLGNSSQWLITSEWESSEPFLSWVDSAAHREMMAPMSACLGNRDSQRYVIMRETPEPAGGRPGPSVREAAAPRTDPLPAPPLASGGLVRHAITFTVKPGREPAVASILAGYSPPRARVDATTSLRRATVFMHGNRVVRSIEVAGDLGNAMRHVAAQPEIRAVEEALNPYLEEARDFTDAASARAFFARAALPAASHAQSASVPGGRLTRQGFLYRARPGRCAAALRLLADLDRAAAADPDHPLARSTLFIQDDLLVRVADWHGPGRERFTDPAADAGPGELALLLDPGQDGDLTTRKGIRDYLASCAMALITDRGAQD
jgi:heme-degrading monooxygenase HmoA